MRIEEHLIVVHDRVEAAVALQEAVCTGSSHAEFKHLEDLSLHLEYHGLSEFVLTDLQEVCNLRWVDLLILGRDKQRGHSKQVQLTLLNALFAHEFVYDVLADVKRFRLEFELAMHIDNPLNEEGARRVLDLGLHRLQIVRLDAA